ncbi:MAG: MaoC family dehydratase N-terminal domain-containing protein [Candidatus Nanopelagicales bacterium]|jgi:acyl dehydratase
MALNPAFVGRTFARPGTYLVGREKVREFASAIGDLNPASHDVAAARALGYADVVAPPTFAIVLALAASSAVVKDPELGLDYSRVVHGEQGFEYVRPVVAGDELSIITTIESVKQLAGNDLIATSGRITDATGAHVLTTRSLLVSRAPDEDPA